MAIFSNDQLREMGIPPREEEKPVEEPGIGTRLLGNIEAGIGDVFGKTAGLMQTLVNVSQLGQMSDADKAAWQTGRKEAERPWHEMDAAKQVIEHPATSFLGSLGEGLVRFAPQIPLYAMGGGAAGAGMKGVAGLTGSARAMKAAEFLSGKGIAERGLFASTAQVAAKGAIEGATVGALTEPEHRLTSAGEEALGFGMAAPAFHLLGRGAKAGFKYAMRPIVKEAKLKREGLGQMRSVESLEDVPANIDLETTNSFKSFNDARKAAQQGADPLEAGTFPNYWIIRNKENGMFYVGKERAVQPVATATDVPKEVITDSINKEAVPEPETLKVAEDGTVFRDLTKEKTSYRVEVGREIRERREAAEPEATRLTKDLIAGMTRGGESTWRTEQIEKQAQGMVLNWKMFASAQGLPVEETLKKIKIVQGREGQPVVKGAPQFVPAAWNEEGAFSALWDRGIRKYVSDRGSVIVSDKFVRPRDHPASAHLYSGDPDYLQLKQPATLGEIFRHPKLYKRIPELKNIPIIGRDEPGASWSPVNKVIELGPTVSYADMHNNILHEVAHALQSYGNFAQGASPKGVTPPGFEQYRGLMQYQYNQSAGWIDQVLGMHSPGSTEINAVAQQLVQGVRPSEMIPYTRAAFNTIISRPESRKALGLMVYSGRRWNHLNDIRTKIYDDYLAVAGEMEARHTAARANWPKALEEKANYYQWPKELGPPPDRTFADIALKDLISIPQPKYPTDIKIVDAIREKWKERIKADVPEVPNPSNATIEAVIAAVNESGMYPTKPARLQIIEKHRQIANAFLSGTDAQDASIIMDKILSKGYFDPKILDIYPRGPLAKSLLEHQKTALPQGALPQAAKGWTKGTYVKSPEGEHIITLFERADFSTLIHESWHMFETMIPAAERTALADAMNKMGVKPVDQIEYAAKAFERWWAGGKAPQELQGIFSRFKQWLMEVYGHIKGSIIDVKINKDLDDVFRKAYGIKPREVAPKGTKAAKPSEPAPPSEPTTPTEPASSPVTSPSEPPTTSAPTPTEAPNIEAVQVALNRIDNIRERMPRTTDEQLKADYQRWLTEAEQDLKDMGFEDISAARDYAAAAKAGVESPAIDIREVMDVLKENEAKEGADYVEPTQLLQEKYGITQPQAERVLDFVDPLMQDETLVFETITNIQSKLEHLAEKGVSETDPRFVSLAKELEDAQQLILEADRQLIKANEHMRLMMDDAAVKEQKVTMDDVRRMSERKTDETILKIFNKVLGKDETADFEAQATQFMRNLKRSQELMPNFAKALAHPDGRRVINMAEVEAITGVNKLAGMKMQPSQHMAVLKAMLDGTEYLLNRHPDMILKSPDAMARMFDRVNRISDLIIKGNERIVSSNMEYVYKTGGPKDLHRAMWVTAADDLFSTNNPAVLKALTRIESMHWLAKRFPVLQPIYEAQWKRLETATILQGDIMQGNPGATLTYKDKTLTLDGFAPFLRLQREDPKAYEWLSATLLAGDLSETRFADDVLRAAIKTEFGKPREDLVHAYNSVRNTEDWIFYKALSVLTEGVTDIKKLAKLEKELAEKMHYHKGYIPHIRMGKWNIAVKTGDELTYFAKMPSYIDSKRFQKVLQEKYKDSVVSVYREREPIKTSITAKQEVVGLISDLAKATGADHQIEEAFRNAALNMLKERGFWTHFKQRKDIPGYEQRLGRVMYYQANEFANFVAKMQFAKEGWAELTKLRAGGYNELHNFARDWFEIQLEAGGGIDKFLGRLRSLVYLKYLGANFKSALVSILEKVTNVPQVLGLHTSGAVAKSMQANKDMVAYKEWLYKAGKQIEKNRVYDYNYGWKQALADLGPPKGWKPEEVQAVRSLYHRGATRAQFAQELFAQNEARWDSGPREKALLGGKTWAQWGEYIDQAGAQAMKYGSWLMSQFETAGRESTALAAFRVFRYEKGYSFEEAVRMASRIVYDAHYFYGKANQPLWMNKGTLGKVAKLALLFRTQEWNYIQMLGWMMGLGDKKAGMKAAASSIAVLAGLGGGMALPFFAFTNRALGLATGTDIAQQTKNRLNELTDSDYLGKLVGDGAPALLGLTINSSVKVGDYTMQDMMMGAFGSATKDAVRAWGDLQEGDYLSFFERALPTAAGNPIKAYDRYYNGVYTNRGNPLTMTEGGEMIRLSEKEAVAHAFGFQPQQLSEAYEREGVRRRENEYWLNQKKSVYRLMKLGVIRNDQGLVDKALVKLQEYNDAAPIGQSRITGKTLLQSLSSHPRIQKVVQDQRLFDNLD